MDTTTPDPAVRQMGLMVAAESAVNELIEQEVDWIIALTQTCQEMNEKLLCTYSEIDAIFSEETVENRSTCYWVGCRPICTPCGNIGSVIQLNLVRDGTAKKMQVQVIPVDNTVSENPEMLKIQAKYQQQLDSRLAELLGHLHLPLEAGFDGDNRSRWTESNAGNMIVDAYCEILKADIAIMNGGGIRANIPAGGFRLEDVYALLPFRNRVCLIEIQGRQLIKVLEHAVAAVEFKSGRFLQVAGIEYGYAPENPVGQRIMYVHRNGNNLLPDQKYQLALPDYLLKGGENFDFSEVKIVVGPESARTDTDVLAEYVREHPQLTPRLEARIKVVHVEK